MNNNIIVENGKTILQDHSRKKTASYKIANQSIIDQMQANYDNMAKGYQHNQNFFTQNSPNSVSTMGVNNFDATNQANFGQNQQNGFNGMSGINTSNLASLLPLLKMMGGKNNTNIASVLENLPQNSNNQANILSQLLPLLANMNKPKTTSEQKIDSLKRAD